MAALLAAAPLLFSGTAATAGAATAAGFGAAGAATFAAPALTFGGFTAGSLGFYGAALGVGAAGLEAVASGVSALSTIYSGYAGMRSQNAMAAQEDFNARQEELSGRQEALRALRASNEAQAQAVVGGAASGIGTTGSVEAAIGQARARGDQELSVTRENAALNAATRRVSSRGYRADGRQSLFGGFVSAAGTAGQTIINRSRRG